MEFRQLESLLAIYHHGSFSAAADILGTTQSNVSAHIARLEKELDSTLIDRSNGRLTPAGGILRLRAERILAELHAIPGDLAARRNVTRGDVAIGLIDTAARWIVPEALRLVTERYPEVRLQVVEAASISLVSRLQKATLHFAVVQLPLEQSAIVSEPLFEENVMLLLREDQPFGRGHKSISVKQLEGIPLLLNPPGSPTRDELDVAAKAAGAELTVKADIDGSQLMRELVLKGQGAAIVAATALPFDLKGFRALHVEGLPNLQVGIAKLWRTHASPPASAVESVIVEIVKQGPEHHLGVHLPS